MRGGLWAVPTLNQEDPAGNIHQQSHHEEKEKMITVLIFNKSKKKKKRSPFLM
jgi:hypothetical protein